MTEEELSSLILNIRQILVEDSSSETPSQDYKPMLQNELRSRASIKKLLWKDRNGVLHYIPTVDSPNTVLGVSFEIGDIKTSVQSANHGNWLLCNGQEILRVNYSNLFALIGTSFGAGDGSTTFNLPNTEGKFLSYSSSNLNIGDIIPTNNKTPITVDNDQTFNIIQPTLVIGNLFILGD